jgi:hypothetical protein
MPDPSTLRAALLAAALVLAGPVAHAETAADGAPPRDAVGRLLERLQSGGLRLSASEPRGYLDSLLAALDIDATSQVLVFSRTSLQAAFITSKTPRALYFNDHTYVGWVQGSDTFEVVTIDSERGPLFFSVHNTPPQPPSFERETVRCLACHDSAGMKPGGIARVLVRSAPVELQMNPAGRQVPVEVSQVTPIEDRWGGWYVTGSLGTQLHLGNLPLAGPPDPVVRGIHNRSNLESLEPHFDTSPYPTAKSDIVALLVLEHQSYVHNLITRARQDLHGRLPAAQSWADLGATQRDAARAVLDPLVRAMTFQDEQRLFGRIRGSAGYEARFAARGPHDAAGRSLRDFELTRRTFRYPVSYLVYSEHFDSLPLAARQYVYEGLTRTLTRASGDATLDADRAAALEILAATKAEFAPFAGQPQKS